MRAAGDPPPAAAAAAAAAAGDPGDRYLQTCFSRDKVCLSFGLWLLSALFCTAQHALLFYLRCGKNSRPDRSVLGVIYCFAGSLCNTTGALLCKQLPIQVFTGAYLAATDVLNFLLILFPLCGSKFKPKAGRSSQGRKSRRKLNASLFALIVPLSVGTGWFILMPASWSTVEFRGPQRRLLGTLLQENSEVLGCILGVIAVIITWTSRIPLFAKICQGEACPALRLWANLFSAVASFLYASTIVAHNRQPEYLVRAVPWFLIALGSAALDLAIIFLSCVMKSKLSQMLGFPVEGTEAADTEALLTCAAKEDDEKQEGEGEDKNSDWVPLNILPNNKYLKKMAAIGRYMELTIEHVQEVGCGATRLPGDGQTSAGEVAPQDPPSLLEPPAYPPIQVIHAKVSSSSSSEVSSINSELEQKYWEALNSEQWDFEDVNLQWSKNNLEMPRVQPLRGSGLRTPTPSDS
ncbi:transmembrane protein 44 [Ornithorhynchus anatinus]|nr:transmembrane protein 44 [Ornithorhynchus anatinus]